jgi:hypothetical protein
MRYIGTAYNSLYDMRDKIPPVPPFVKGGLGGFQVQRQQYKERFNDET